MYYKMEQTTKGRVEEQREIFNNSRNFNWKKGFLGGVMSKFRNDEHACSYCSPVESVKLCDLCGYLIINQNPTELYQKINSSDTNSAKTFELVK